MTRPGSVDYVAFSPDSKYLLAYGHDHWDTFEGADVRVRAIDTGVEISHMIHYDKITSIASVQWGKELYQAAAMALPMCGM